jgi:hypothetical protein
MIFHRQHWTQRKTRFTRGEAQAGVGPGAQRRGDRADVLRVGQDCAVDAIGHDLAGAVFYGGDDGKPHREGFEDDQRAGVVARWQDEEIGGFVESIRVARRAGEDDPAIEAEGAGELLIRRRVFFADDDEGEFFVIELLQREERFAQAFSLKILRDHERDGLRCGNTQLAARGHAGVNPACRIKFFQIDGVEKLLGARIRIMLTQDRRDIVG